MTMTLKKHHYQKRLINYGMFLAVIVASITVIPAFANHFSTSWAVPPWTTRQSLPQYGCSGDGKTCANSESSSTSTVYAKATGSFESKSATIRHNYSISPNAQGLTPQKTISSTENLSFEMKRSYKGYLTIPSGSSASFGQGIQIWKLSGGSYVVDSTCGPPTVTTAGLISSGSFYYHCTQSKSANTYRSGVYYTVSATEDWLGGLTTADFKYGSGYGIYTDQINICHLGTGQSLCS